MVNTDRLRLWVRWSWRDLRARWIQVLAIACIIAIGTGLYSGLSSTSAWRRDSYDRSYAVVDTHDVKVALASGTYTTRGTLAAVVASTAGDLPIKAVSERLSVPTQVDASVGDKTILASGRIIGVDVAQDGPPVDRVAALDGRGLVAGDDGTATAVLDVHFAKHYHLAATGSIRVGADTPLTYVGQGEAPEHFLVLTDSGSLFAEASYAVVYTSLTTAQSIAGRADAVNEVVIQLDAGADRSHAVATISNAFARQAPDVAVQVTSIDEDRIHMYLYGDIDRDQRFFAIFAGLVLVGAAFAAFNLTGRMVEAQRREIGVGMALGVEPAKLVIRPMLVAFQVSLAGSLLGTLFGIVINGLMRGLLKSFVPLPVWRTSFQFRTFLVGASLGLILPLIATVWPVLRAVRVAPIDALRTSHLASRGGWFAPLMRHAHLPGNSIDQMPLRDVLRAPRRTLFTVLGIATAVATLVSVMGILDTFFSTIDKGEREILSGQSQRMTVELDGFYPLGTAPPQAVEQAQTLATVVPALQLGGTLKSGSNDEGFDVFLTMVDFTNPLWVPTAVHGSLQSDVPGIVISEKAARDLHVKVGGTVTLHHPKREGLTGYRMVDTELPVIAIHPNPYRFAAFMDIKFADTMNLAGIVNLFQVAPKSGVTSEQVQRELFGDPGVAAAQPVTEVVRAIRDYIGQIVDILNVARGAVLLLVLLIAFNSSSISADERRRQHATMFAFGIPVRRVVLMTLVESVIVGIMGTAAGIGIGYLILQWIVHTMLPDTVPELGVVTHLAGSTVLTAAVMGVIAVGLAPLFNIRRLRRTRIPDALRVME
jgi:putative ABC transport system permease protein